MRSMRAGRTEAQADDLSRCLHRGVEEVYRDASIWVLAKPAGVLSHPNPPARQAPNALVRGVYDFKEERYRLGAEGGGRDVFLVHRLDMDTSGLILCAFDAGAAAALKEALYRQELRKEYQALLLGVPEPAQGRWSDRLEKESRGSRVEVRAVRGGREANAVTAYRVLKVFPASGLALAALEPLTGRTHQLRVQAARRGLAIAGDERYGDFRANRFLAEKVGLRRMFLHSSCLEFRHPRSGHRLCFRRGPDQRLAETLERVDELAEPPPRRPGRLARAGGLSCGAGGASRPSVPEPRPPRSREGRGRRRS
jgi:23S rRNA-/tRNA-specific pseudouridylate synthase